MGAWLTPDTAGSGDDCIQVVVPFSFSMHVMGAISELTKEHNWEKHGTLSKEQCALIGWQIYESALGGKCAAVEYGIYELSNNNQPSGGFNTNSINNCWWTPIDDKSGWAVADPTLLIRLPDGFYTINVRLEFGVISNSQGLYLTLCRINSPDGGDTHTVGNTAVTSTLRDNVSYLNKSGALQSISVWHQRRTDPFNGTDMGQYIPNYGRACRMTVIRHGD